MKSTEWQNRIKKETENTQNKYPDYSSYSNDFTQDIARHNTKRPRLPVWTWPVLALGWLSALCGCIMLITKIIEHIKAIF